MKTHLRKASGFFTPGEISPPIPGPRHPILPYFPAKS
jgi:hypothetical protein